MGFLWKESIFIVACLLINAFVNTTSTVIAVGRKEGTTKDLKVCKQILGHAWQVIIYYLFIVTV